MTRLPNDGSTVVQVPTEEPSTAANEPPAAADEFVEDAAPSVDKPVVVPQPFPVDKWREITRAGLAILLVVLLAVVMLVVTFTGLSKMQTVKDATDFLGVILSPLVGLVGAATGFYYAGGGKKD